MAESRELDWSRHPRVTRAATLLHRGAVIAYPTEGVWGLGCDPMNRVAVMRLLAIKDREPGKGLILIAADYRQLLPLLGTLTPEQQKTFLRPTTTPVTWLAPASHRAPTWITGGRATIAVRITRFPLAVALCRAFGGPLVSTSANPAGRPPARSAMRVRNYFRGKLDDILPGVVGSSDRPSEIRDLVTGSVIRPGGGQ